MKGICYICLNRLHEGGFVASSVIIKFGFRIRTRSGLIVDNLLIHARDEADAERKLRQMYQYCKILQCTEHRPGKRAELATAR